MADEENNQNDQQTPDEAPQEAPDAPVEPAEPAEAPPADEPVAEPAPEDEGGAGGDPLAEAVDVAGSDAGEAEPEEPLSPKDRRRRARSAHRGEARPQRTPEERAQERVEARRKKAEQRRRWRQSSRERRRSQPKAEPPAPVEHAGAEPRVRQGIVVSDRADKTITVKIEMVRSHRMYGKVIRTSSTLHAHDEANDANVGDTVRVVEARPMSKLKRWRLVEVLERAR